MAYLTQAEFEELGFTQMDDFDKLETRAEHAVDLYTGQYLKLHDLTAEHPVRQQLIKTAVAYQVAYLYASGTLTADDKQTLSSISIGRTSVSLNAQTVSDTSLKFNLSSDAINYLEAAGFGYRGIGYDR